jgi:hypothetical protein
MDVESISNVISNISQHIFFLAYIASSELYAFCNSLYVGEDKLIVLYREYFEVDDILQFFHSVFELWAVDVPVVCDEEEVLFEGCVLIGAGAEEVGNVGEICLLDFDDEFFEHGCVVLVKPIGLLLDREVRI